MEDCSLNRSAKVSVIIPVFNAGELIGEMIESILSQSYQLFELILVDDGSTDNTSKVVNKYMDSRISYYQRWREPKGAQTCRNLGFEKSKGEYVCFFDADDLLSSNCLEQRVNFMEANPTLDFGIFPASIFSPGESISEITKVYYGKRNCNEDAMSSLLKTNYQFLVVTNIFRKSFLLRNHIIWDEAIKVYQDFDFNFSILRSDPQYAFCESAVIDYFYRVHHSSTSVSSNFISVEKCESTLILFNKVLETLDSIEKGKERKIQFASFIRLHFVRLLESKNKSQINDYLELIRRYYGNGFFLRYFVTSHLSLPINNRLWNKIIIIFFLYPINMKLNILRSVIRIH